MSRARVDVMRDADPEPAEYVMDERDVTDALRWRW